MASHDILGVGGEPIVELHTGDGEHRLAVELGVVESVE
jgi:hypothetical protein